MNADDADPMTRPMNADDADPMTRPRKLAQ